MNMQKHLAFNSLFLFFITTIAPSSQLFSSESAAAAAPHTNPVGATAAPTGDTSSQPNPDDEWVQANATSPTTETPCDNTDPLRIAQTAACAAAAAPAISLGQPYRTKTAIPEQTNNSFVTRQPLDPRRLFSDDKGSLETSFAYLERIINAGLARAAAQAPINFRSRYPQAAQEVTTDLQTHVLDHQSKYVSLAQERRACLQADCSRIALVVAALNEKNGNGTMAPADILDVTTRFHVMRDAINDQLYSEVTELTELRNAMSSLEAQFCSQHPDASRLRAPTPPIVPQHAEELFLQDVRRRIRTASPTTQARVLNEAEEAVYLVLNEERARLGLPVDLPKAPGAAAAAAATPVQDLRTNPTDSHFGAGDFSTVVAAAQAGLGTTPLIKRAK